MFEIFFILVFLCSLHSIICLEKTSHIRDEQTENEEHNEIIPYTVGDEDNSNFHERNHMNEVKESQKYPAKFPKYIRITNCLQPTEQRKRKITLDNDEDLFKGKFKNNKKRCEWKIEQRLGANIMPYLINKDFDIIKDVYDKLSKNYSNNEQINEKEENLNITKNDDKVTLMQLENESKESMSRQFRENQRKTKPFLIIQAHQIIPATLNHNFVKRSLLPRNVPCFDDYEMVNIPVEGNDGMGSGYSTHFLGNKNIFKNSVIKPFRNVRNSKYQPEFQLHPADEAPKKIRNSLINNYTNNGIKQSLKDKDLKNNELNNLPTYNQNISEHYSLVENKDMNQDKPDIYYKNENLLYTHMRTKHQQNWKNTDSEYFSSDLIPTRGRKHRIKNMRTDDETTLSRPKKKRRKFRERNTQSKSRDRNRDQNEIESDIHKHVFYQYPLRIKKQVYRAYNYKPNHIKKRKYKRNEYLINSEDNKNSLNKKMNYVPFSMQFNDQYEDTMNYKTDPVKLNNNENRRIYRTNTNASLVAEKLRSYQNNANSLDLNIVGELTPSYPIACERVCPTTQGYCCKLSTVKNCGCRIILPTT